MPDEPKKPTSSAKDTTPKIFDVMRPGKAQASASSRPIITGHKPQVQDSTLTDNPKDMDDSSRPLMSHKAEGVKPVNTPDAPTESDASETSEAPAPTQPTEPTPAAPILAEPTTVEPAPPSEPIETEPSTQLAEPVGVEPEEPETPDSQVGEQLPEDVVTAEPPEENIPDSPAQPPATKDSSVAPPSSAPKTKVTVNAGSSSAPSGPAFDPSKIVVSHHNGKVPRDRKWGRKLLLVFIILLLAAVAAYGLYDAGIIKTNLNLPHTGLFKKKQQSNDTNKKDNTSQTSNNSSSTNSSSAGTQQDSTALNGYTQYSNQSLGFAFAYPKAWGALIESTPTDGGDVILNADSADVDSKATEMTGKFMVIVSKKDNYQVVAAKYGATVQPTNQGGNYSWKVVAVNPADTKDKVGDTYSATIARKTGSLTVFDFTSHSEGCTMNRWVFETSGGYVEVDAPEICPKTSGGTISAQAQADYKSITDNILGSIATL